MMGAYECARTDILGSLSPEQIDSVVLSKLFLLTGFCLGSS